LVEILVKIKSLNIIKWIIIITAFALAVVFLLRLILWCDYLVFIYPENQVSMINNITEKVDLINKYRVTSIQLVAIYAQILGACAVFLGIYFAWGNLTTAREGQITERFTRAIDQLGNKKMEIRIGGMYALERIANESKKDYWSVMEILTAYIEENARFKYETMEMVEKEEERNNFFNYSIDWDFDKTQKAVNNFLSLDNFRDHETACNIIARRKFQYVGSKKSWSFLHNQRCIEPSHICLGRVNLPYRFFKKSHLENANFFGSFFNSVHFEGAYLQNTFFSLAIIINTKFNDAILENAFFEAAYISKSNFEGANLRNANFDLAIIKDTNFKGAKHLKESQMSTVKLLQNTSFDEKLEKNLKIMYPALFKE
jgi:Uncharacterized low-complexity proteins